MNKKLEMKKVQVGENNLLLMNVKRENGKTKLSLKVCNEIEMLFRKEDIKESDVYKLDGGKLSFYALDSEQDYERLLEGVTIGSYGRPFIYDGNMNFSILRTVGIAQGVELEITHLVSEEALTEWAKKLKEFVVKLYKNYLKPVEITVTIQKKEVC